MSYLAHILAEKDREKLIAPCIYTTGFAGKDFTLLPGLLDYLGSDLIDIRFDPAKSGKIEWSKNYLRMLLQGRYRHLPHLGNRLSKATGTYSIQNLALGIKIITGLRKDILLMCECAIEVKCHRSEISRGLIMHGYQTQEITDWERRK